MKKTPVFHPFLFAAVPILFLFAHNSRKLYVAPGEIVLPLLVSVTAAILVWFGLRLLLRDGRRAGVLTTVLTTLFYLYGHLLGLARNAWRGTREWHVLLFLLLIAGTVAWLTVRARREFRGLTVFLNAFTAILLVINIGASVPGLVRGTTRRARPVGAVPDVWLPDIYYIILDGHGRADVLRDLYGYDSSEFLEQLRRRGFHTAANARSNYCQTYLSLASTLNLTYLDSLADAVGRDSDDRNPVVDFLQHNIVMDTLRAHGYRIVTFASGYSGTEFSDADVHFQPRGGMSEYRNVLVSTTPLPLLLRLFNRRTQHDLHRDRARYILRHLPDAASVRGPVFTFAHILPPHPPFVFGEHGEAIQVQGLYHLADGNHYHHSEPDLIRRYVAAYRRQVAWVDRVILRTVDEILARSLQPPVIIIQADHGPGSRLNQDDPRWTDFTERLSILNTCYYPDTGYQLLYDSITPVNTFRRLLNKLLGKHYERLPDHSFYATWNKPYQYYDIDTWHAGNKEIPDRVAVVAFRQAETQPSQPRYYYRRLAARKLPGTEVGPVFLYLVDEIPTVEDAYARYREAVEEGAMPDFGNSYDVFLGHHGPDWKRVLALLIPLDSAYEPSEARTQPRITVITFRCADDPPHDPVAYAQQLVRGQLAGAVVGPVYFTQTKTRLTVEQAVDRYREAVAQGNLPDLGVNYQHASGTGPDGKPFTALFFPTSAEATTGQPAMEEGP